MGRRIDADREGHQPGENYGDEGDGDGQEQPIPDDIGNRQPVFEGIAEVPLQHPDNPMEIAFVGRQVEAIFLAQELDLVLVAMIRMIHVAKSQGKKVDFSPRFQTYFENKVGLNDLQIQVVKGLSRRVARKL